MRQHSPTVLTICLAALQRHFGTRAYSPSLKLRSRRLAHGGVAELRRGCRLLRGLSLQIERCELTASRRCSVRRLLRQLVLRVLLRVDLVILLGRLTRLVRRILLQASCGRAL